VVTKYGTATTRTVTGARDLDAGNQPHDAGDLRQYHDTVDLRLVVASRPRADRQSRLRFQPRRRGESHAGPVPFGLCLEPDLRSAEPSERDRLGEYRRFVVLSPGELRLPRNRSDHLEDLEQRSCRNPSVRCRPPAARRDLPDRDEPVGLRPGRSETTTTP
jgi:hypothetical protein